MGGQQTQQTSAGQQQTQRTAITSSQNEATVVERMGGASAEPTVLERQMERPKKNSMVIGAIAAAVVIALAIGGYVLTRPKPGGGETHTGGPVVSTAAASGTQITATAASAGAQGKLLLSASPWGELEKIVNLDNHKAVDLSDEERSTPTTIDLDPGQYAITVRGPDRSQTIDVRIAAGQKLRRVVSTAKVNYDEIEKEVQPQ
jgi:hypothetical protein